MTKKELLQVFQDFSEQYGETYEQRAIFDSNFGELADVLLKKSPALDLIAQEREKQISKGYTVEDDVKCNDHCQLSEVAMALCSTSKHLLYGEIDYSDFIPYRWCEDEFVNLMARDYKERLIIAGALIAAELERLLFIQNKES